MYYIYIDAVLLHIAMELSIQTRDLSQLLI